MARETRKFQRSLDPKGKEGKRARRALSSPMVQPASAPTESVGRAQLRSMAVRLGLPVLALWVVGALIAGLSRSNTVRSIALGLPGVVTLLAAGLLVWGLRHARKAKDVHSILSQVKSAEDRAHALDKLDAKKKDPAAVFAKAQLLMQDDPRKALAVLEELDLTKLMAPMADEARAQRAMIHLVLGEVSSARPLADGIDLSRHQEAKSRAMLTAVVGEAWARSGQSRKALDTLTLLDPEDAEYEPLRPQLYRALAYAYAHTEDVKSMRRTLKRLLDQDIRLLGSFLGKRTHPLLLREAKKLIAQSGLIQQKMVVQRR
ncbi:hypothetical protein ACFL5O_03475 [Myxococcota bacterium]